MVKLNKCSFFYHHGDTICYPRSGYVTTKLHGTSTCRCNNNAIFSDSYFQVSSRLRMPATLIWPRRSLGSSCQTEKMAALLNSLFFVSPFVTILSPFYRHFIAILSPFCRHFVAILTPFCRHFDPILSPFYQGL